MLDTTKAHISTLFIHRVGNKLRSEGCICSASPRTLSKDEELAVLYFFLSGIHSAEEYRFTHPVAVENNDVADVVSKALSSPRTFPQATKDLAALLYEASSHPKIKAGDVYFARIRGVRVD